MSPVRLNGSGRRDLRLGFGSVGGFGSASGFSFSAAGGLRGFLFCSVSVLFCSGALLERFCNVSPCCACCFFLSRQALTLAVLESDSYWRVLQLRKVQSSLMKPLAKNTTFVSAKTSSETRKANAMDVARSVT